MSIESAIKAIEEVLENYGYVFFPFFSKKGLEKRLRNKEINYIMLTSPSYKFSFEINITRNSYTQIQEKLLRELEGYSENKEIFMFVDTLLYIPREEIPEFPDRSYLSIGKFVPLNFLI